MFDKKKAPASGGAAEQGQSIQTTNNVAEKTPKIKGTNNRYWVGVLYPESMRPDWRDEMGDILQLPYAYGVHDLDTDSQSVHRKDHIHLILAFANTTTYKHALEVFNRLSAEGKKACNTIEPVTNIRHMYEYLIHNTETCKKKGKHLYPPETRVCGNGFDIGSYEQISLADKQAIAQDIAKAIKEQKFINIMELYEYVMLTYDNSHYFEVLMAHSAFFERLTKGNYQKWQRGKLQLPSDMVVDQETGEVLEDV